MKRIFLNALPVLAVSGSLLLSSCGGSSSESTDEHMVDSAAVSADTAASLVATADEMTYQVPSPKEMFYFIKQVGGKNNKRTDVLNNPNNVKNYTDAKTKAINFGIYSCDLTYCSIFEIGSDALKYFKTVRQLGDEVGVANGVSADVIKRLEKNMGNPDSLVEIADNLYFSSFESLQNGQQGNTLALVVAGGYIEGLSIACNLIKYDKKNMDAIERIADEKYTLENVMGFMKKYENDAAVKETIAKLGEIKTVFDQIAEKQEGELAMKKEKGGAEVLGGGSELEITEAQYKVIAEKVNEIRNSFTGK